MTKRLHNSLIEVLIVAGFDTETGLRLKEDRPQVLEEFSQSSELTTKNFEPEILAVISHDVAHYPTKKTFNIQYPPVKFVKDVTFETGDYNSNVARAKYSKIVAQRRASVKALDSPIQADILKNLPQFCFPEVIVLPKIGPEPSIHSFVLTDIEGSQKFCMCLTYFREFYCSKNEYGGYDLVDVNDEEDLTEEQKDYLLIYIPTALVLISKFFYFDTLQDCVSNIYHSLIERPQMMNAIIENFAFELTHLPIPPKITQRFNFLIEYSLPSKDMIIFPLDEDAFDIFGLDLSFLFNKFSIDKVLNIILSILSEAKIVFTSKEYGLLTPTIQCFLRLIYPFKWRLPYVPVLPCAQIAYLEAPHPFIMGIHSDLVSDIEEESQIVIINIDNGSVKMPEPRYFVDFPQNCLKSFKNRLRDNDLSFLNTKKLTSPKKLDWKSAELFEKELIQKSNKKIIDLFLEFYVNLFGDLYSFIKIQTQSFNKKAYLESQSEENMLFYQQILDTAIFELFINDLIKNYCEQKNDEYFEKLEDIKSYMIDEAQFLGNRRMRSRTTGTAINILYKTIVKQLKIPKLSESNNQLSYIINLITKEIESSNVLLHIDCLLYMRGLLNFSCSKTIESFKDFYSIASKGVFPRELIAKEIWPLLSKEQRELIREEGFYKNSAEFKKIPDERRHSSQASATKLKNIEEEFENMEDLSYIEFSKRLERFEIRIDCDTVERLFSALSLKRSDKIDFSTFEVFLDTYQAKNEELQKVNKYLPTNILKSTEFALKVTNNTVIPKYGIGRIILTQKCIYFLEQGTNKRKTIVELHNVKQIDKDIYNVKIFNTKQIIKITTLENETIPLMLEEDRNLWYLLISELCNAIYLSKENKDSTLVQYAAKNVLLIDAVAASGHDNRATHYQDLARATSYLDYYTTLRHNSNPGSTEAKQTLSIRIRTSNIEFSTSSVEVMVCVEIDENPTLWCAVGNQIKIYEATTWTEEADDLKMNEKITCMVSEPNESKIWIGTMDKCIYVLDVQTRSFNKKIEVHTDVIVSLCIFEKLKVIVSGSANGELFTWDTNKLKMNEAFKLDEINPDLKDKVKLISCTTSRDYFICNTSSTLQILNSDFQLVIEIHAESCEKFETFSCITVSFNRDTNEELLWAGNTLKAIVWVWSLSNFELLMGITAEDRACFRVLMSVNNFIWAGSQDGKLSIFCGKTFECEKSFEAHADKVRSLCYVQKNKFVVSGSGSKDGTIAVWKSGRITRKSISASVKKLLATE